MANLKTTIKLNNGLEIPQVGLGVYLADNTECYDICKIALAQGWKHIDSAYIYKNEQDVGRAVRESCVKREELFITTKVQGFASKIKIFIHDNEKTAKLDCIKETVTAKIESCLEKLDLGYIDLLLIHAPFVGWRLGAWSVMETYVEAGKIKSIGVSYFGVHHIGNLNLTRRGTDQTLQDQASFESN
jgi:diketogulonate reductase-like aldo/keto reductase